VAGRFVALNRTASANAPNWGDSGLDASIRLRTLVGGLREAAHDLRKFM
jgi:hypothetical protein